MKSALTAATTVLFILLSVFGAGAQDFDQLYAQADSLFNQGQYVQAKASFLDLWQRPDNPKRGETWVRVLGCHKWLKENQELENFFQSNLSEFQGTVHEAEGRFVRADAMRDNLKDSTAALAEFEYILAEFPNAPNAAPGSLYRIGLIQLEDTPSYSDAIAKFDAVISRYGDSPYVARSYLSIMKASAKLKDAPRMDAAFTELQTRYPDWRGVIGEAWLVRGEFQWKEVSNKLEALKCYQRVIDEYPNSYGVPLALVRAADIVPYGNIDKSIEYYQRVVREFPNYWEAKWAQTELGVCYYLKDELTSATQAFERVLEITTAPKYANKARMYLEAMTSPESISAIKARFDVATRKIRDLSDYDTSYWDFARIVHLSQMPFFNQCLNDSGVSKKDKAELLYKLSMSYFNLEERAKAMEVTERILSEYTDQGEITALAFYNKAFQLYRNYQYDAAIALFQKILIDYPEFRHTPETLQRLALAYDKTGDHLTAVRTLNFVVQAYPGSVWADSAQKTIEAILLGRPDVEKQFAQYKHSDKFPVLQAFSQDPVKRQHKAICDFLKQVTAGIAKKKQGEKLAKQL